MAPDDAELLRAFGDGLRRARQRRALTQEAVALQADVARTYLNEVERGHRNPTLLTIRRLSVALGVPLEELFAIAAVAADEHDRAKLARPEE